MKKKNIFDTDIEMVDLNTIGNLEVSYDEMSSPNPELANDVQMVMKETQVFSADEVAAAIQRNNDVLNDLGNLEDTKVINSDELSEIGETKVIDTVRVNELEAAEENETGYLEPQEETENSGSDYIVSDGDYEFETEDSENEYEGEETDAEYEDEPEEESAEEYDEESGVEEDYEEESEEEYEDYEFEPDRRAQKHIKTAAAVTKNKKEKVKPEKNKAAKEAASKEAKAHKAKDEKASIVKSHENVKHNAAAKDKKISKHDAEIEIPAKVSKHKNKKNHNTYIDISAAALAEGTDEMISGAVTNDEMNNIGNDLNFEKRDSVKKKKKKKKNKDENDYSLGLVEYAGIAIGVILIILLVVLGAKLSSNKIKKNNLEQFASIGALYSGIDSIGNEGITAIAEQKQISSITPQDDTTEEVQEDDKEKEEEEEEEEKDVAPVSVNFSSIEKDLKIKFVDKATGKLVTGIRFEVKAKGPKGDVFDWVDTDLDGVIYIDNLEPGTYEVTVVSVDPYEFPETATKVKVQDTVVYQVINVIDEAVDMSQVNLAQEDNQVKDVDQGTVLQDTVKLVESSATPVNGKDGFVKVNKADIKDPKTFASAYEWGGFRRVDDITIEKGQTVAGVTSIPEGCTLSWSDGGGVAQGNADGTITGLAAGSCTLDATIKNADESVNEIKTFNITVTEPQVQEKKVTALTINGSNEVKVGASIDLTAGIEPADATNKDIVWTSLNPAAATVENGKVTGVAEGTAQITISTTDGSVTSQPFTVTVKKDNVSVTGVTIQSAATSVMANQTIQLTAVVAPDNATNKGVTWSSNNTNVATVDAASGVVKGVAAGTAKITVKTNDGAKEASIDITVTAAPQLALSVLGTDGKDAPATLTLYKDSTYQLGIKVTGYATDGSVTTASSSNAVTVSGNGLITAAAVGTADVTITTKEKDASGNQLSKKITVTVKDDPTKDTTKPLTYSKDGKDLQLYYKNAEGNYVEAKWADYYKYDEFYVKGNVEYKYTGWQTLEGNVYYFTENGDKVTGEQVIGGTKYNFASDGSLVKDSGSRGIDVSAYQGTIDWTAVKNSGISFVIIRCGFRGYTKGGLILDSKYQSYIQGATAAGLKVGLYIFSQATNESEAIEEASLCVNLAQGYKISYPIFIDSEYANGSHSGRADGLDKATRTAVCKAFCETIKSAGYTPGVYASKSWYYNKLDAGQLSSYKIWLAHYCGETDYKGKYDLWQHTSKGSVNGIKGNVDLDISYLGY